MSNTRENPNDPDSPFLTDDFFRNARPFRERFPHLDTSDVTAVRVDDDGTRHVIERVDKVNVSIALDLVQELRETGPDWQSLAEDILRSGLKERQSKAA